MKYSFIIINLALFKKIQIQANNIIIKRLYTKNSKHFDEINTNTTSIVQYVNKSPFQKITCKKKPYNFFIKKFVYFAKSLITLTT